MSEKKIFYSHEPDSKIMVKKDRAEVNNWTDDLEYIIQELEYLLGIEDRVLNNRPLYLQLHDLRRENQLKLGILYRYEASMRNAIECDTTDCDAFYLHKHEQNRNVYIDHLKKYRRIKSDVLSKILQFVER
ncbi:hypothetical protein SAMN05421636_108192 [Pricia antarctica]|uniref:Uncharacterized protein n=1 Tax=Pricia antarctica TaxID=641691 RepID=A0A1G7GL63_9FLAO|nr:hypothetical protein [Pricia antarctica]SDE88865.1 hypothetical protein SAMN05421636_108192 [Pricia antarctica]